MLSFRHGPAPGKVIQIQIWPAIAATYDKAELASQAHIVSFTEEQEITIKAKKMETTLNSQAQRAASMAGYRAIKSRCRVGSMDNYGRFMLINKNTNQLVAGARFELTADDIIAYCA